MNFKFNPLNAIFGLLQSRKFVFTQVIFIPTVWLCHSHCIGDTAFAAVVSSLTAVFLAAHTFTDIKSMAAPQNMMDSNKPTYTLEKTK